MSIKQLGGVFGRNPTFNDVTIEGELTFDGDIDINSDLKIDGNLEVTGTSSLTGNTSISRSDNGVVDLNVTNTDTTGTSNSRIRAYVSGAAGGDPSIGVGITGVQDYYWSIDNSDSDKLKLLANGSPILDFTPAGAATFSDNIIIGTSGKGIDFSATAGTGTSELLDDYEEGVWTPTAADAISGGNIGTTGNGSYTKIGNFIMVTAALPNVNTTGMTAGNTFHIQGLPFVSGDVPATTAYFINSGVYTSSVTTASPVQSWINDTGVSALYFYDSSGVILVSDITSGAGDFYFTAIYQTA